MSSSDRSAGTSPRQSARNGRMGGALSLIGGSGLLGALFLPWLSLTLVSEQICSADGCSTTPSSASVRGWEIFFTHPFVFLLLLPLFVLSAAVNMTSGVLRLRAPQWKPVWFWCALLLTSAALTAFVPWLITFPLPGADAIVDGHIVSRHYAWGLYIASAVVLVALVGTLLQHEQRPVAASPASTYEQGNRAVPHRRVSSGLVATSLIIMLVFAAFFIVSAAALRPLVEGDALYWWKFVFFLIVPPILGGLALTSLLYAFRYRQRVWLGLLCLSLTQVCLGWVYVLSGYLATPGRLVAGDNAGMVFGLLWGAYLLALLLCFVYALVPRTRRASPESTASMV
jgi:hypothetical protein